MNPVIDTLTRHRTYRQFKPDVALPPEHIQAIADAARQAPSWMNGQHYSIIRITDVALRRKITAAQPANPQVGQCSELWVFIADLHRAKLCADAYMGSFAAMGTPDTLITACVDTGMAAQNAIDAAESLGYGTCPVGGLRAIAAELIDWLGLPQYTFPLFGLCIGVPDVAMRIKPRLPEEAVLAENHYPDDQQLTLDLHEYETIMTAFGEQRERWPFRQKFARYYSQTFAPQNIALLRQQGFLTHPNGLPEDQEN